MKKRWVIYPENTLCCNNCDGVIRVNTTLSEQEVDNGLYQDGDEVECVEGCIEKMYISCDGDGELAFVSDRD